MLFRMFTIRYYSGTVVTGSERQQSDSVLDTVNSVHLAEKRCVWTQYTSLRSTPRWEVLPVNSVHLAQKCCLWTQFTSLRRVHLAEKCCLWTQFTSLRSTASVLQACHGGRTGLCVGDNANTCLLPSIENVYTPGSGVTRIFLLTCQVATLLIGKVLAQPGSIQKKIKLQGSSTKTSYLTWNVIT